MKIVKIKMISVFEINYVQGQFVKTAYVTANDPEDAIEVFRQYYKDEKITMIANKLDKVIVPMETK